MLTLTADTVFWSALSPLSVNIVRMPSYFICCLYPHGLRSLLVLKIKLSIYHDPVYSNGSDISRYYKR